MSLRELRERHEAYKNANNSDISLADFQALEKKNEEKALADDFTKKVSDEVGGIVPYLENEQVFILDYFLYNYNKLNKTPLGKKISQIPANESAQSFLSRVSVPNDFDKLIEIRPSDYARLTPSYEIFKVLYDGGSVNGEIPFIFSNISDLSGLYQEDSMFRGHGAGIKSVSINLEGKNSLLSHNVSAKLTLMFQDINTIWTARPDGASYVDLFSYPNRNSEQFYRIKMLLGYNGYSDTSLGDITLRYSKLLLLLDYTKHTIEINENGTCKVVVDYFGSIEYVLSDPEVSNILSETEAEREYRRNIEKIKKNLEKDIKDEENRLVNNLKNTTIGDIKKNKSDGSLFGEAILATQSEEEIRKEEEKKIKDSLSEIKNAAIEELDSTKNSLFSSKIERLLGIFKDKLSVYTVALTVENIIEYRKWLSNAASDSTTNSALTVPLSSYIQNGSISEGTPQLIEKAVEEEKEIRSATKFANNLNNTLSEYELDPIQLPAKKSVGELSVENLNSQFSTETFQLRTINFVLLKDLMSAIIDELSPAISKRYNREFKILFGNIVFQPANSDNAVSINIGDIPISLTKLNYFLVDKVVGKGISVYTFQQFFDDLFKEFFVNAVEAAMKMRSADSTKKRMKNNFTLDYLQLYEVGAGYTVMQTLDQGTPTAEVLFIYGNTLDDNLPFTYEGNKERKIPHMFFGGVDRGIVKKIKFTDNTNAKVKAAIWEQNKGNNTEDDLSKYDGTLAPMVYTADITLIGYPYIINGNLIFIDTSALGLDQGKAVNLLIGGYYTAIKVTHELSVDKFETKVSATLKADYRLKGKITERVSIIPVANFGESFSGAIYDPVVEGIKKEGDRLLEQNEKRQAQIALEKQHQLKKQEEAALEYKKASDTFNRLGRGG